MASDREQEWLDKYLESGDAQGAVKSIFDCTSQKSIACRASQLKRKFAIEIDKRLRDEFSQGSVAMLKIIKSLATSAQSEQVKLNAAKDYLDRGGYKPVDKQEVADTTDRIELESDYNSLLAQVISELPAEQLQAILDSKEQEQH